jgi:hypothetical protein
LSLIKEQDGGLVKSAKRRLSGGHVRLAVDAYPGTVMSASVMCRIAQREREIETSSAIGAVLEKTGECLTVRVAMRGLAPWHPNTFSKALQALRNCLQQSS